LETALHCLDQDAYFNYNSASYTGTQVGHIIFIQGQLVYVLTVYCYMINGKASNTNLSVINDYTTNAAH